MALKPLNSVGGFSVGETPNVVILPNAHIFGSNANITGDLAVTANATIGNVRSDNYQHANGDPIDFQQAAGANTHVQFNLNGDFGATANFIFDDSTQKLVVLGNAQFNNANLGNLLQANFAEITNNIIASNVTSNTLITASAITGSGNASFTGSQVSITNNLLGNTATFSGNISAANANLGNLALANYVTVASNTVTNNLQVNLAVSGNTANFSGNVTVNNLDVNLELSGNTANFSGNVAFNGDEVSIANDLQGNTATFSGNASFDGDEVSIANDLQGNTATFSGDVEVNNLDVNLELSGNTANFSGNVAFNGDEVSIANDLQGNTATFSGNVEANNLDVNLELSGNTANFSGNVAFNGDEVSIANDLQGNTATFSGNASFDGDEVSIANDLQGNTATFSGNASFNGDEVSIANDLQGNTATFSGNIAVDGILTDNFFHANGEPIDFQQAAGANNQIQFNDDGDFGASANLAFDPDTDELSVIGLVDVTGNVTVSNNTTSNTLTVNLALTGNTANFSGNAEFNGDEVSIDNDLQGNTATFSGNVSLEGDEVSIDNDLQGNTATFSGDVVVPNLDVNLALSGNTATFSGDVTVPNLNVNLAINGNTASFSGNIDALNANLGNLALANFVNVANDLNVIGNINAPVVNTGKLANGTSNVRIFQDANVELSVGGTANIVRITTTGLVSAQDIETSDGNVLANGNITANGFVIAEDANIANVATIGSVTTAEIDAPTGNLTLTAAGSDSTITLVPTGNGTVDVSDKLITSVANPETASDAATKEYVDEVAQGLKTRTAAWVLVDVSLDADYDNGPLDDGVGATLTADADGAFPAVDDIDSEDLNVVGARILVTAQTNPAHNGLYVLDIPGDVSTKWQLRRCIECSTSEQIPGSFVFVQKGTVYGATGWKASVDDLTTFTVGTDAINWIQFSGAGTFTAGDGLTLTGTEFSVNTDEVTTTITDGNVVVKANAQFTTPNIGAATGTSIDLTGNASVKSLSVSNIANIDANLTVGGIVEVNGTIASNANVSGLNFDTSGNVLAGEDVVANNVTANTLLSAPTGNITTVNATTGNITTVNATDVNTTNANITDSLTGNTATFSGNVTLPNLTVNLELAGNTANFTSVTIAEGLNGNTAIFTGNIQSLNANLGNLAIANFFTGTLIDGTSNLVITENGNITLTASGNASFVVTDTGANVVGNLDVTEEITANTFTSNTVKANTKVEVGDTKVGWGTVTTEAITANQTIAQFTATGFTGVEFIVKGEDTEGSKHSVATVAAVTDGTSVDYVVYATAALGGSTGSLAVNKIGSNIALQVTPSSSNTTVWTAQFRTI